MAMSSFQKHKLCKKDKEAVFNTDNVLYMESKKPNNVCRRDSINVDFYKSRFKRNEAYNG